MVLEFLIKFDKFKVQLMFDKEVIDLVGQLWFVIIWLQVEDQLTDVFQQQSLKKYF